MKKKRFLAALALLTAACVLLITACPDDPGNNQGRTPPHTNTAFLVGTWTKAESASFTIANDLSFVCQLITLNAQVSGSLDATSSALGPNDYLIKNMATSGEASEFPGNTMLSDQLSAFQNLPVTLTPNTDKTTFTFSSTNGAARMFFGGTYTKHQP